MTPQWLESLPSKEILIVENQLLKIMEEEKRVNEERMKEEESQLRKLQRQANKK